MYRIIYSTRQEIKGKKEKDKAQIQDIKLSSSSHLSLWGDDVDGYFDFGFSRGSISNLSFVKFALLYKVSEHLGYKLACRSGDESKAKKRTSIVSNGPPALSGWNWTPQTFMPDSVVDLTPSTEESLQLMKNGSHP